LIWHRRSLVSIVSAPILARQRQHQNKGRSHFILAMIFFNFSLISFTSKGPMTQLSVKKTTTKNHVGSGISADERNEGKIQFQGKKEKEIFRTNWRW